MDLAQLPNKQRYRIHDQFLRPNRLSYQWNPQVNVSNQPPMDLGLLLAQAGGACEPYG